MRILYIHQYFITPAQQGGTRSYEFARYLVSRGHQVTMLTSGLSNPEFPVAEGELYTRHAHEGIDIVAIRAGYNDARAGTGYTGMQRMRHFLHFARTATYVGKQLSRPDLVFATHTPLTVGLSGRALKRHFRVPFVFEVRDLWPEALVNIGALGNPLVIAYLRWMARRIYRAADHIIALSPGMKAGICRQHVPEAKVTVIPNSSDLHLFRPDVDGTEPRQRMQLGDRFTAIYFGAMGQANGLDYILDAAALLKRQGQDQIALVLHGDGGDRRRLMERAEAESLDNVIFSGMSPKSEMPAVVAACDACMTIFRATREVTWSPNKLFDALAAGRPVVVNVGQWLSQLVESNGCGRHVAADRPEQLAEVLTQWSSDRASCEQMGRNARALAEREFDRQKLAGRLEQVFEQVTGKQA